VQWRLRVEIDEFVTTTRSNTITLRVGSVVASDDCNISFPSIGDVCEIPDNSDPGVFDAVSADFDHMNEEGVTVQLAAEIDECQIGSARFTDLRIYRILDAAPIVTVLAP